MSDADIHRAYGAPAGGEAPAGEEGAARLPVADLRPEEFYRPQARAPPTPQINIPGLGALCELV